MTQKNFLCMFKHMFIHFVFFFQGRIEELEEELEAERAMRAKVMIVSLTTSFIVSV